MSKRLIFAFLAGLLLAPGAWAHGSAKHGEKEPGAPVFDRDVAFEDSRGAIGNHVGRYTFLDRQGRPVELSSFRGKPLVVSMIYTSCPHFCPMISHALASAADIAREAVGEDSFNIVSIGFDTRVDTPKRMAAWAREQGLEAANWEFLSADHASVDRLARDLGFTYASSPNGFDHLAQTTVLDAEGKIYTHVYGTQFKAPFLVEPLKDLVFGRASQLTSLDGLINRVRLFCTVYNPATGRYDFDYSLFILLGIGGVCLSMVGLFVTRAWLSIRRRRAHAA